MSQKKKIRVLECIRQGQIGGGESHLLTLVEHLDKEKFEPVVLSFTDGPMIERLQQMDVETHIIQTEKPFDIRKWRQVRQLLDDLNIDLVHAHGTRANSNILWATKSLKIPLIYTIHGWSFHQDQQKFIRWIRVLGEKYLISRSDINISVSASNQKTGQDHIPFFKSIVVNNGIDRKKFNPDNVYKNIRKGFGISEDVLLVLFLARFTSHKQPISLINAFSNALATEPNLHLLMVGDGDQKSEAIKIISERGLQESITLSPFRQDVPDLLAAADLYVLPSLWEGLPIGLLEAMAMGKAVIASNVDGTSEIIEHNVNGYLVETEHLETNLTKALIILSKNKNLRDKFSVKAIETVNDRFNAVNMTRQIENIYNQLSHSVREKVKTGLGYEV